MTELLSLTCPHCGSNKVIKYGVYEGVQRYYCNVCKRKFKADEAADKIRDDWTDPRGDVRDIWSALSEIWQSLKSRYEVKK